MSMYIRPFRALRPRAEHAAEIAAPPYDVLDTEEARTLAADRPRSFLHVSRPEIDFPAGFDPHDEAAYARGAENFQRLVHEGALVRDETPAFYVWRMTADRHVQTGVALAASVRAYEAHRIKRHELTRPDKEHDRVRHIEVLNAQTGPVLCAYRANAELGRLLARAVSARPLLELEGPYGVVHTLWRVDERGAVEALGTALNALGALYIADGHHRSAAAACVAHSRRTAEAATADASYEQFLAVAFPHDEMRILDYNRLIADLNGMTPPELLERTRARFRVERAGGPVRPDGPGRFGMYLGGEWYLLALPAERVPPDPVEQLDVSLLQTQLIAPLFGIEDPRTDPRIAFVGGARGLEELARRVDAGHAAVAFALFPTHMEQLMAVADAGRLMPPKSTWFEPKLADGLLSHVLD